MVGIIIVAVASFGAGSVASARWLPELADTPVGTIAFFIVCGLLGAALCVIGLDIDLLVRELQRGGEFAVGSRDTEVVGARLSEMLYTGGTLAALALVAFLLAPKQPAGRSEPV